MTAITSSAASPRDYSLTGRDAKRAVENGLAAAEWYHTEIPRKQMKELMQRSDGPAIRDTLLWLVLLIGSAAGAIAFWGTWWCVPFFFVYGVLYGSSSDSRWHECGHGTAFRTRWMNDVVYQIASFMLMRNPVAWRWSHARHHTDTIIVGRDAEIAVMRPPDLLKAALMFTGLLDFRYSLPGLFRQAFIGLNAEEKSYIPEMECRRAVVAACRRRLAGPGRRCGRGPRRSAPTAARRSARPRSPAWPACRPALPSRAAATRTARRPRAPTNAPR